MSKRVLFIASDNYRASGAFISMTYLNKILREGFDCYTKVIIPAEDMGDGVDLLDENGIPYEKIRSFNWCIEVDNKRGVKQRIKNLIKGLVNIRAVNRIAKVIKEENIDIVHINTSYSYVGAKAAHKAGAKLVWHVREFLEEDQGMEFWNKPKAYALFNSADRIIAISNSIKNKYQDVFDPKRVQVIYNGIDPERFFDADRIILEQEKIVGLCVGRITEKKGQFDVIKALTPIFKFHPQMELWLVGKWDDTEKQKIDLFTTEHGITPQVKFLGPKSNVEDYYKKADIYFMTSSAEAFGRVTVEAMLSGCLVVGADCGATGEIIEHGVSGFLYDKSDIKALTDTVTQIIEHPTEAKNIAGDGRMKAYHGFLAEINAEHVYNMYEEVLGK